MSGILPSSVANFEFVLGGILILLSALAWFGVFRSASIFDIWGAQVSVVVASLGPIGLGLIVMGIYTLIITPAINSNLYLYELVSGVICFVISYLGARLAGHSMGSIDMGGVIVGAIVSFMSIPGMVLFFTGLYTLILRLIF